MWIVENGIFSEQPRIEQALKNLNIKFSTCTANHLERDFAKTFCYSGLVSYSDNSNIFYGSIISARQVYKNTSWQVWVPDEMFDWHYYAPRFGQNLFNKDYFLCPFGQVKEKGEQFFGSGERRSIFVKPNSGYKPFTGMSCRLDKLEKELGYIKEQGTIFPEEICVVARSKTISREYRLLVVDNKVICGSQYLPDEQKLKDDHPALQYASFLLPKIDYYPCLAWTLDIAESYGKYSVLEVNSFSSAGLYHMDMEKVVDTITRKAYEEIV